MKDLDELIKELADFYGIELIEKTAEELEANKDFVSVDNLDCFGLSKPKVYSIDYSKLQTVAREIANPSTKNEVFLENKEMQTTTNVNYKVAA